MGTAFMQVRYRMITPNSYTDLDLLRVFTGP
jgi:hypothetical protein